MFRFYVITSLLFGIVFSVLADTRESNFSMGMRVVNWNDLGFSEATDYDNNSHTFFDYTVKLSEEYDLGVVLDQDNNESGAQSIALQLGYKNWNYGYERGVISGKFVDDSFYDIQLAGGTRFKHNYNFISFYKGNSVGGKGYAYLDLTVPTTAYVEYLPTPTSSNVTLNVLDPGTRFQLVGKYLFIDKMRNILYGNDKAGWGGKLGLMYGIGHMKYSDRIANMTSTAIGQSISSPSLLSVGYHMNMEVGYFDKVNWGGKSSLKWSYAAGWRIDSFGSLPIVEDLNSNEVNSGQSAGPNIAMNHGPFIKISTVW